MCMQASIHNKFMPITVIFHCYFQHLIAIKVYFLVFIIYLFQQICNLAFPTNMQHRYNVFPLVFQWQPFTQNRLSDIYFKHEKTTNATMKRLYWSFRPNNSQCVGSSIHIFQECIYAKNKKEDRDYTVDFTHQLPTIHLYIWNNLTIYLIQLRIECTQSLWNYLFIIYTWK